MATANKPKVVLGKAPEKFTKVVPVVLLDGTEAQIACEFKYRSRTEFGKLLDALKAEGIDGEVVTLEAVHQSTVDANARYLSEILLGWDLDVKLNMDNLKALSDEMPGAALAIMVSYREAVVEGRLGN